MILLFLEIFRSINTCTHVIILVQMFLMVLTKANHSKVRGELLICTLSMNLQFLFNSH